MVRQLGRALSPDIKCRDSATFGNPSAFGRCSRPSAHEVGGQRMSRTAGQAGTNASLNDAVGQAGVTNNFPLLSAL